MSEFSLVLTSARVLAAVAAGCRALEARKQEVNNLNVYPVPDGDTGTNLALTVKSVLDELQSASPELTAQELCALVEEAALMGARGNSGVILSQMVRGAMEELGEHGFVGSAVLPAVLRRATETAYRAVRKPVEGTMLTVLREMAEAAEAIEAEEPQVALSELVLRVVDAGWQSVERTPSLLRVLADAGVVDAGGFGLVVILEGIARGGAVSLHGLTPEALAVLPSRDEAYEHAVSPFTYCTSFLLKGQDMNLPEFEAALEPLGDSLLVVGGPTQLKVHIHTDEPGVVLALATARGVLHMVEIDNMKEQTLARTERLRKEEGETRTGAGGSASVVMSAIGQDGVDEAVLTEVVAVVAGEGNKELFVNLGATSLVEGGQTMNPSAEQLVQAVRRTTAPEVIILPNNKNIILAAEQIIGRVEGKAVLVLPTRSMLAGLSAMVIFDPHLSADTNAADMQEVLLGVASGEVTRAVRDSRIDDMDIREGAFIGLIDGKVMATGPALLEVAEAVAAHLVNDGSEVMTVLVGDGEDHQEADAVAASLAHRYAASLQVDVHEGGQPLYPLLLSVE
ncbi:MAG: DAK2 domain-containing protein [Actinobacteria bacterium]|nr:DAK2 domain-containing protein [Actinomycetota bacterium]